jgi:putative transport protein
MLPTVDQFIQYINDIPLVGLMLVVAIGWIVGRIEIKGVGLSPAGGVLLVALVFGYFGLDFNALYGATDGVAPRMTIGTFGFALFIYAIGFEAGPRFFSSLGGSGARFVALALVTNAIALGTVLAASHLFKFDGSAAGGVLAGALTSTPALVSASEVAPDMGQLTLAYALAYPYGQVGLLLMIAVVPILLKRRLSDVQGKEPTSDGASDEEHHKDAARSYKVENPEVDGKTLRELRLPTATRCIVVRVKRGPEVLLPGPEVPLLKDDIVMATGKLEDLQQLKTLLGPEVYEPDLRRSVPQVRRILVTHRNAVGRTIADLDLMRRYNVVVVRVDRAQQFLDPKASLELQRFDVLEVVGRQARVRDAARVIGSLEQAVYETNIAIYALGIVAGMLIGWQKIKLGGIDVTLSSAGGLLLVGLLLGRFRRVGRFSANVPRPARQLVRDLGILLFVSEAGVLGGQALVHGFGQSPWMVLVTGACTTTFTVLGTLWFGQKVLRLKPIDAWGGICGGMTSTTSLEAVNRTAGNNDAVIGYAATYAVASVLITLAGQLAVRLSYTPAPVA